MLQERRDEFRALLQGIAESLDISETQYEMAVKHYETVGEWLNKEDSSIVVHQPKIYPQGSFRLGTMIKPINDADQYDIDLVCELKNLRKENVSQKQLKQMVGDRLKENERYQKLVEGKRCWKLPYADSARFHMDILPAIPDHDMNGTARMIGAKLATSAILITDTELPEWQRSNPIGYAGWFKERMQVQFNLLAKSLRAGVDPVPDYKVKTPLQRSIQILKRHRDIRFAKDCDDRPISIIISTLSAQSYNNEADLLDALQNIINGMPHYIENRNGITWVPNPVNPLENFADKWQTHPLKELKFRVWLKQVQDDIDAALRTGDLRDMVESLKPRFGDRIINQAVSKTFPTRNSSVNVITPAAPHIVISKPGNKPWAQTNEQR